MQYDNVEIRADEVRAVVKKFERKLKSGRVFFPEDAAFAMKYETLLKNAASGIQGLSVSGKSFTAVDRTTYSESDQPKSVAVDEGDIIAIFDNTKKGLFGNFAKKECAIGALVTTKGVLTYNVTDGTVKSSGFVTWPTIAVAPKCGSTFETGIELFPMANKKNSPYPRGPRVSLCFWNAAAKALEDCLDEMRLHFVYIARGKGNEFDYGDHAPEVGYDKDDADEAYEKDDADEAYEKDDADDAHEKDDCD